MSNMSYCRFQNTLPDLRDCRDALDDEVGPEEEAARKKLIKICREIVADPE